MRKGRVMSIIFHESSKTFHLYNNNISYIMTYFQMDILEISILGKESMTERIFHIFLR